MPYKDKEEQRKHDREYMRAYRKRQKENNGVMGGRRRKGNTATPFSVIRVGYFRNLGGK